MRQQVDLASGLVVLRGGGGNWDTYIIIPIKVLFGVYGMPQLKGVSKMLTLDICLQTR